VHLAQGEFYSLPETVDIDPDLREAYLGTEMAARVLAVCALHQLALLSEAGSGNMAESRAAVAAREPMTTFPSGAAESGCACMRTGPCAQLHVHLLMRKAMRAKQ
jgi:hypothetical protein